MILIDILNLTEAQKWKTLTNESPATVPNPNVSNCIAIALPTENSVVLAIASVVTTIWITKKSARKPFANVWNAILTRFTQKLVKEGLVILNVDIQKVVTADAVVASRTTVSATKQRFSAQGFASVLAVRTSKRALNAKH